MLRLSFFRLGQTKVFRLSMIYTLRENFLHSPILRLNFIFSVVTYSISSKSDTLYRLNSLIFRIARIKSKIDTFLTIDTRQKQLTSLIYDHIFKVNPTCLKPLKAVRDQDLRITMSDEQWGQILGSVQNLSICASRSLLQCKFLHRINLTNARLAKIYPDRTHTCNRCTQFSADYMHMFWLCPHLSEYWIAIFHILSGVLGKVVDPDPLTGLFRLT